jgi:hypothetical protein
MISGNFADELGEDFLGLRDLGIAREHGMDSLSVPTSIFYGRKKRQEQIHGYVSLLPLFLLSLPFSLRSPSLPAPSLPSFTPTLYLILRVPPLVLHHHLRQLHLEIDITSLGTTLTTSRKEEGPEYPPPRPFLPLTNSTWQNQLPNLFHAFFNARQEAGQGFQDEGFDHSHFQIGSLGQIVIKAPPLPKKKVEVERKKKVAKVV